MAISETKIVLIIFPLILQTIIIAQTMSAGGKGDFTLSRTDAAPRCRLVIEASFYLTGGILQATVYTLFCLGLIDRRISLNCVCYTFVMPDDD